MKTALVTGANRGIGQEVACQLVVRGFHVFIGARNADAGLKLAQALTRSGGKATFLKIDVADADGVLTAAREYERLEDHLDVLVNNAGILLEGDSA